MRSLTTWLIRRRGIVVAGWLAVLALAAPFAAQQNSRLTSGGFDVPGSQSQTVANELRSAFPDQQAEGLGVLIAGSAGATQSDYQAALRFVERVIRSQSTPIVVDPAAVQALAASGDGPHRLLLPLRFRANFDQTVDIAKSLNSGLRDRPSDARLVDVYLVGRTAQGAALQDLSQQGASHAETLGFPVVLLVLLAVFGSLLAALLPLSVAAISLTITGAAIYLLSRAAGMSIFVTNITSMIGIGVAVDYSLFMLVRYREEIGRGATRADAERSMLRTSGLAVIFSGSTVVVALATVFAIDSEALRSMALGAIVVVGVSVLTAVTLLPALIRLFGSRVYRPGWLARAWRAIANRAPARSRDPRGAFWSRWTRRVTARPWRSLAAAVAILVVLAVPARWMVVGDDTVRQLPASDHVRQGAAIAAQLQGPGAQSPVLVAVRLRGAGPTPAIGAEVADLAATLGADPAVAAVLPAEVSQDGGTVVIPVVARYDSEDSRVLALVRRMRGPLTTDSALARDPGVASVEVGGSTATAVDLADLITGKVWLVVALLLALTYLVLLLLLRSVLLPLQAIVLNLLSVAAAFGVLVAVFQWHWTRVVGVASSVDQVQAVALPLILTVVFGLSMDYEVFLLTRIKERYEITGSNSDAVSQGVASSARTITSAALIMVVVFGIFVAASVPVVQQIGVGTAVAIGIDATITRLVLLPATMQLFGRWTWWVPRPLAAVLPRLGAVHGGAALPARAPAGAGR
jgi:RND superfamily putative drug exporter